MKLLSWNVGLAGPIFRKFMCIFDSKMVSINNICHRIIHEDTDIIALQEVYNNDFNLIKSMLNSHYPNSIHEPKLGLCFFSKPPISHEYKIIFPRDALSNCLRSKNGLLIVRQKNTRNFFCNVHLSCGIGCEYEYEYVNLVRKFHLNDNLTLIGDFNAFRTKNYKKIANRLYINRNSDNTFSSYRHPFLKCNFDYIVNYKERQKNGTELNTTCINDYTSDHYPIIAEI